MSAPSGEAIRNDFQTEVDPTLFIDNWGRDVVTQYPEKVKRPVETAVALAQLMAAIREGTAVDADSLDCSALDGVLFFDASGMGEDHFFSVDLKPRFTGGSHEGPRVAAGYTTGSVRLAPYRTLNDPAHVTEEQRWTTLRGDVIAERARFRFEADAYRLDNALAVLEGASQDDLVTARPETWPSTVPDPKAYEAGIRRSAPAAGAARQPVYLGDLPVWHDVVDEPPRRIHIPFLDG